MVYGVSAFAKLLSDRRKELGLSQADVGAQIGAAQSYIGRFESGRHDIRLSRFVELARILGFELVLLPKTDAARLKTILRASSNTSDETPLYVADDDETENADG